MHLEAVGRWADQTPVLTSKKARGEVAATAEAEVGPHLASTTVSTRIGRTLDLEVKVALVATTRGQVATKVGI